MCLLWDIMNIVSVLTCHAVVVVHSNSVGDYIVVQLASGCN